MELDFLEYAISKQTPIFKAIRVTLNVNWQLNQINFLIQRVGWQKTKPLLLAKIKRNFSD